MPAQFSKRTGDNDQHERFVELCAVSTSGSLNANEREQLNAHLAVCAECRELLEDFSRVVREGFPLLAQTRQEPPIEAEYWSASKTKQQVFARLQNEELVAHKRDNFIPQIATSSWKSSLWYVAAAVMCISLFSVGYLAGLYRQRHNVRVEIPDNKPNDALKAQLSRDRDNLEARVQDRTQAIENLSSRIAEQGRELDRLKSALQDAEAGKNEQNAELTSLRQANTSVHDDLQAASQKLQEAQTAVASLQHDLERAQAERVEALLKSATAEEKLAALSAEIESHQATVAEQQKLLASNDDIRELMGARDLLIADVYDNDKNGNSLKAFGRVFYTKNKSLRFYAFDLAQTPQLKSGKTFQVWGEDSKKQTVNLGTLYLDNEANRRWVLKFDNPEVMRRIDAVFVTIEPHPGSKKPSGDHRLYASLRTPPNHP